MTHLPQDARITTPSIVKCEKCDGPVLLLFIAIHAEAQHICKSIQKDFEIRISNALCDCADDG